MKKQRNKAGFSNNAGFSLLEVILAMAILAIISIPLLSYFSDSMKYNVKMADKQHATNLAQEIVENLKAQEKLVQDTAAAGGSPSYGIPYLTGNGYVMNASGTLTSNGVGTAVFTGAADSIGEDYDVKISVDTNKDANTKLLPQIYGIDDTSDVLLEDDNQFDQALTYFRSVNTNYAATHPGAKLSDDAIRKGMKRKITVTIRTGTGSGYDVVAKSSYSCAKLEGSSSGEKTFDLTDDLVNTHLGGKKAVHAIYFLYRYHEGAKEDTLEIESEDAGVTCKPEVHIVCQNPTEIKNSSNPYHFYLNTYYKPLMQSQIYTNLSDSLKADILYGNGTPVSAKEELVTTGSQVRTVEMQVEIYQKGKMNTAGAEPYITVKASKGE